MLNNTMTGYDCSISLLTWKVWYWQCWSTILPFNQAV